MRAICIYNDRKDLADHQRHRAEGVSGTYPLTMGKAYTVLGMGITENVFEFLVPDDLGNPRFAPAGLFSLDPCELPSGWKFGLGPGVWASGRSLWADPVVATWGYPELVDDPGHGSALQELDDGALAIFEARRREAEFG